MCKCIYYCPSARRKEKEEKKDKERFVKKVKESKAKKIPTVKLELLNGVWELGAKLKIFKWNIFISDKHKG